MQLFAALYAETVLVAEIPKFHKPGATFFSFHTNVKGKRTFPLLHLYTFPLSHSSLHLHWPVKGLV